MSILNQERLACLLRKVTSHMVWGKAMGMVLFFMLVMARWSLTC